MTPTRCGEILTAMEETQRGLARRYGWPERLVRYMASGDEPIPEHVAAWLEEWWAWWQRRPVLERHDGHDRLPRVSEERQ